MKLAQERPVVWQILQGVVKFSMLDIKYGFSSKIFILTGVVFIATALFGKEGWTGNKELEIFILGTLICTLGLWLKHHGDRTALSLYGKWYGVTAEWRNMAFDIRESYLNALHQELNKELPGIVVYGRYDNRAGSSKETDPTVLGHAQYWENRPGKFLKAICWVWKNDEEEVRLEYRRGPGNIYAARFYETKGLVINRHDHLRTVVDELEWSCEPRFGWICRLGKV